MELNIFEYSDYRQFLRDYYAKAKETKKCFSYRFFAKKAQINSPALFNLILTGRRNLSKSYIPKFATAMGLKKREQNYLETLISFNHAKTPEAKRYYLELLNGFKRDKDGAMITESQYEYLSNWYYPVIRELITLSNFKEDPEWIRKMLCERVTIWKIKKALETMLRLELIKRDETSRLVQNEKGLTTKDDIASTAAYSFHEKMLKLAAEILVATKGGEREISGITMALSDEQFSEIKSRVRNFEDEIIKYLNETSHHKPNTVFQLNVQLMPMTLKEKEEANEVK